jgi:hypothetical protein
MEAGSPSWLSPSWLGLDRPQLSQACAGGETDSTAPSDAGDVGPVAVSARAVTPMATIAAAPATPNRGRCIFSND